MQQQKLADFINLFENEELFIFLQGDEKRTPQMKYDTFVKVSLEKFNLLIREYVHDASSKLRECKTIEEIETLKIPVMPNHIRKAILEQIDKQKILNIVEKVYLFLDLFRAVSTSIGKNIGTASLHYANAIKALKNLNGSGGGHIVGLDGQPLSQ